MRQGCHIHCPCAYRRIIIWISWRLAANKSGPFPGFFTSSWKMFCDLVILTAKILTPLTIKMASLSNYRWQNRKSKSIHNIWSTKLNVTLWVSERLCHLPNYREAELLKIVNGTLPIWGMLTTNNNFIQNSFFSNF